jgi:hypothetical protein
MWCLIDLVGRTAVAGGDFEMPEVGEAYECSEGDPTDGFPIVWLDVPQDWHFREADEGWMAYVEERAAARSDRTIDARAILFGRPLLEHIAHGVRSIRIPAENLDKKKQYEATRAIHARWLMTAREDLGSRTPRQILLADRSRIQRDLEHRSQQWTKQGHAPVELPIDSFAYRHGGFGTIEVIVYFDLVRTLLSKGWELIQTDADATTEFLMESLEMHRDQWLRQPYDDGSMGQTAAELVEFERRRLPIISDGMPLDCDCPICRAEAEGLLGSGPSFVWFDGHHLELEDEFAFSMHESYEEWESEQEAYRDFTERLEEERKELAASGAAANADGNSGESGLFSSSIWKSSFVDWDNMAGSSRQQALFALAFPIAELVSDVKEKPRGVEHVRSLNEAYDNLRRSRDPISTSSAARMLGDSLEELCQAFPELTAKCADLQSHLDEFVRRIA